MPGGGGRYLGVVLVGPPMIGVRIDGPFALVEHVSLQRYGADWRETVATNEIGSKGNGAGAPPPPRRSLGHTHPAPPWRFGRLSRRPDEHLRTRNVLLICRFMDRPSQLSSNPSKSRPPRTGATNQTPPHRLPRSSSAPPPTRTRMKANRPATDGSMSKTF